jgi:hypothetical protein
MIMMAMVRPVAVGLVASAMIVGGFMGSAAAGPGSAAVPAVAIGAADERSDGLVQVNHKNRHHRFHHHGRHHHGHHNEVVVIERHHPVPVYREHVEHYYYYDEPRYYVVPRRPYLVDLLTGGVVFVFEFD